MKRKEGIYSIGFEGPNRVGKGVQIAQVAELLSKHNISSIIVRGDGSRPGLGEEEGDPISAWWATMNPRLRGKEQNLDDWNTTSSRLARETIIWRDRVLPNKVKSMQSDAGVLLIDRTLLSRTMIPREKGIENVAENLYPIAANPSKSIDIEAVCPDIIFQLEAPLDVLLARLDPADPKYHFRKRLLTERYEWFMDAHSFVPDSVRNKVVHIDAYRSIEDVSKDIASIIEDRLGIIIK